MTATGEAMVRPRALPLPTPHAPHAPHAPHIASRPAKPRPISGCRDFTIDLAALALALSAAVVVVATVHPNRPVGTAAGPLLPAAVLATVLVSLYLNGAWDARAVGRRQSRAKTLCHGYAWAIAVLCVVWSSLGIAHELIWILNALPAALALSLLLHAAIDRLTRTSLGFDPRTQSVVVVGDRAGVLAFLTQTQGKRLAHLSVDAICLAADPGPKPPGKVGAIPVVGSDQDLVDLVRRDGYTMVILLASAGWGPERIREAMWELEGAGVDLSIAPPLVDMAATRLEVSTITGLPLLHLGERAQDGPELRLKAAFDRGAAALGIALALPVLCGIALAIRLTSKGPALYRQIRTGRDGIPFTIYKFRTMTTGSDAMLDALVDKNDGSGPLFKCFDDPRVTGVGRLLRRYSIDELPQLFNVALGTMSLIGPRPPLPAEVRRYTTEHERRRLLVRPGITGLWQVSGRSDLSWEETIRHDLYYVENWSTALDAKILWKTLGAVTSGRGAY